MTSPFEVLDQDKAIKGVLSRANVTINPDLTLTHWLRMDGEVSCRRISDSLNTSPAPRWAFSEMPDMIEDIDASL